MGCSRCDVAAPTIAAGAGRSLELARPGGAERAGRDAREWRLQLGAAAGLLVADVARLEQHERGSVPMWACPNAMVQWLSEIEVHEELLAEDKVVNLGLVDEDCWTYVFVSQSWASFLTPTRRE